MQRPIVVVGSLNLDLVARVNHHPAIGETITGLGFNTYCGGKGANQAVALARLSAPVKMIGKLGSDAFAAQLRHGIESAGVDASCVENVPGASGTALILSSTNGDNSIVVIPGANAMLLPEDIERHRQQIEGAIECIAGPRGIYRLHSNSIDECRLNIPAGHVDSLVTPFENHTSDTQSQEPVGRFLDRDCR